MTFAFDQDGFRALNALAGRSDALDAAVIFGAEWLVALMAALLAGYLLVAWNSHRFEGRFENLTHVLVAVLLAFAVEQLIGWLWFRPRPFAAEEAVTALIAMPPSSPAFPSSHSTFAFAVAFAMLIHDRKWGWPLLAMAAAAGLSRVAAGVHYPTDVMGGLLVGAAAAVAAAPVKRAAEPFLELSGFFRRRHRVEPPKDLL